jgi:S1-C subfamily serine protease
LESAKANDQLAALRKSNPATKATVVAVPLNVMNAKVAELNKQLKDKTKPLVAPIIVNDQDRQQAVTLLKAQGLTEKQINEGLSVPVFFTKPFMLTKTPQGQRGVFFLSYQELQNSLSKLPPADRDKLKPQVADLTAVLREIIKDPEDNYVIFPTPEYFRLVKETQAKHEKIASQNLDGSAASNSLPDPNPNVSVGEKKPVNGPSFLRGQRYEEEIVSGRLTALSGLSDADAQLLSSTLKSITIRIESQGPSGSGVVVAKAGRVYTALTAWHVVEASQRNREEIYIVLNGSVRVPVDIESLRRIGLSDMAIFSFSSNTDVPVAAVVMKEKLSAGMSVFVAGWSLPTRDQDAVLRLIPQSINSISSGATPDGYSISYSGSTPSLPGMSGGPLVNRRGELVGIHGRAERQGVVVYEGVKELATATSLAMPISLYLESK